MFEVLPKPSDLHPSFPTWCFIAPLPTHPSPSVDGRRNLDFYPPSVDEDDGLELSLGLSLGGSFSSGRKSEAVKPLGLNLKPQKELSLCAEASLPLRSLSPPGEVVMHDQPLSTDGRPVLSYGHGVKEEHKKYEAPIHQSREQVWQALLKNGAVSVQSSLNVESATFFRDLKDASASRRSASMQLMEVVKEGSEVAPQLIERSTSNCVPFNMMAQQLHNSGSAPLSRQVSSVECLLEKHPETLTSFEQQQVLELQRKKEMQAQRRQEARKRRKSLIEEKQQKKAKRDESCIPQTKSTMSDSSQKNSSTSVTTQDGSCPRSQNSGAGRLGSKDWMQSLEKRPSLRVSGAECSKDEERGEDDGGAEKTSLDFEKAKGKERRKEGNMCKEADEGDGAICSETESWESKEEHSSVQQNELGEMETSSIPCAPASSAAAQSSSSYGGSAFFPSMVSPFPVMPIPYPFHLPASSQTALPLQMGFFMQYPPPPPASESSSQLPASSSMSPYPLPMADASFPWLPLVPPPAPAALSSCALPFKSSTNKEFLLQHPQGKLHEDAEKSSVVAPPLHRANSTSNIKEVASVPAPQQCPAGAPCDTQSDRRKASTVNRNVRAQRQKKLSLIGQTSAQDTGAVEQSLSFQVDDHPKRSDSRLDKSIPSKDCSREPKQEEGSADSQLASEVSGQEGSSAQPGMVENEKSASILDLPWVSTTGVGPNGKTINGVMYISKSKQVRLVCSCHGNHMSPTEFVEHSGSTDLSNPERSIVVNPFPFLNQLATTPV